MYGTEFATTITDFQNGVLTSGAIAPRESSSFSESPTFLNTATGSSADFLHIDPSVPTQVESGGTPNCCYR